LTVTKYTHTYLGLTLEQNTHTQTLLDLTLENSPNITTLMISYNSLGPAYVTFVICM